MLLGLGAYLMWGLFPLYFRLLEAAGAVEIVLHRIVWSLLACAVMVSVVRGWGAVRALTGRQVLLLAAAAAVLSVNWGVFVWAVNSEQVVETSLGYFINPLVSVLLGVLLLGERLRRAQWAAVARRRRRGRRADRRLRPPAVDRDRPGRELRQLRPASRTGSAAGSGALPGLTVETAVLAPLALAGLVWLAARGQSTFTAEGPALTLLLMASGVLTALPLLLFAGAARRVPLSTIGLLQYITPVMQLLIGVVLFGEPMPPLRLVGLRAGLGGAGGVHRRRAAQRRARPGRRAGGPGRGRPGRGAGGARGRPTRRP